MSDETQGETQDETWPDAPAWQTAQWFNTEKPLSLAALRGKVIVLSAFQMLCPGCVLNGLPQAKRIARTFSAESVAVVGLHTVFEHHQVMTPAALEVFLHEYQITFPVGVDLPRKSGMPATMTAYGMQGTPTLILIDRKGRLRKHSFGSEDDLRIGAAIAFLLAEEA